MSLDREEHIVVGKSCQATSLLFKLIHKSFEYREVASERAFSKAITAAYTSASKILSDGLKGELVRCTT